MLERMDKTQMPKVMSLPSFQFRLEEEKEDEQDIQDSNNLHTTGTVIGNERFYHTRRNLKVFIYLDIIFL